LSQRYPISKHITVFFVSWGVAAVVLLLRWTCRVRVHNDPRGKLRSEGKRYIFSVLHAHQVSAIVDSERGTGAMVSRSLDGQIIVPALRVRGVIPVRGSGGKGRGTGRGGREALDALIAHVRGGRPAYLAVDGPRGPRGHVHKGVAVMARACDAAVLLMVAVPKSRWILKRSWDRLQIPKPFTTIDGYFAEPIFPAEDETAEQLRQRIENALLALDKEHDPSEAVHNESTPPAAAEMIADSSAAHE
jgi:lysophospholipid acyltransferase (LPLAT)-like uncharacterized protein